MEKKITLQDIANTANVTVQLSTKHFTTKKESVLRSVRKSWRWPIP